MELDRPLTLLGGLSAAAFMRRHWQKKPLLIRAASGDALPPLDRALLFGLAARDDVESRLVSRAGKQWTVRHGPFGRRALPTLATPRWTLLVQGVDLHDDAVHRLLQRFRFVADARLDDVRCSFATDGGGVGPHVDSYDVFLLQIEGRRRWSVGRAAGARLRAGVPLKMLADFAPTDEWLLGPGDMLYVPPGWGHDGIAVGECITASIGFRAPHRIELAADMAERIATAARDKRDAAPEREATRYRDAASAPAEGPARIPPALQRFADDVVERLLADRVLRARALGETLSEPKPGTWFERHAHMPAPGRALVLDRRTRMLYDDRFIFINGESHRASGSDATLLRRLADERELDARSVAGASPATSDLLAEWLQAGWCLAEPKRIDEDTP
jgi:50S ribosomal protein L16 3-hydroxylase